MTRVLERMFLTIAAANRGSLDTAGSGECQSLSLINLDPQRRATAIKDLAQALWLRPDHTSKLCAAPWRWGWGVSCDIVQAWWHADDHIGAAWLSHGSCPQACYKDHGQDCRHPWLCHWILSNLWTRTTTMYNGEILSVKVLCCVDYKEKFFEGKDRWFTRVTNFSYFRTDSLVNN